jgi:hypothetical protein
MSEPHEGSLGPDTSREHVTVLSIQHMSDILFNKAHAVLRVEIEKARQCGPSYPRSFDSARSGSHPGVAVLCSAHNGPPGRV